MKTILWNVDTQFDFMREGWALPIPGAKDIEENLAWLVLDAEKRGRQVVNTADWHGLLTAELSMTPDYKTTFPPHCMRYTAGAEFVPATKPENPYVVDWNAERIDVGELTRREIVIYKDKFDVFAGNPFADKVVEAIKPERAIVFGVATNVCVDYAVRGLLKRGVQVYVPTDAIKELPGLPLPYEAWKELGAVLTTTEEVLKLT